MMPTSMRCLCYWKDLNPRTVDVKYYAVSLLRKIGPPAKDALPILKKILEESDSGRMTDFLKQAIASIEGDEDDDAKGQPQ